jgi:pimeloyl-ACP methyl ester carboxylesterase
VENRDYRLSSSNTDRPVLVLGHSLGTNFSLWDPVIGRLEQNFRLLFYNPHLRQARAGNASVESRGKQLIELLDYLGFQQIDFCGVSMSGLIGQWLALAEPKCIRNLILVNTAARIGNPEAWQERISLVRESGLVELATVWWPGGSHLILLSGTVSWLNDLPANCARSHPKTIWLLAKRSGTAIFAIGSPGLGPEP